MENTKTKLHVGLSSTVAFGLILVFGLMLCYPPSLSPNQSFAAGAEGTAPSTGKTSAQVAKDGELVQLPEVFPN